MSVAVIADIVGSRALPDRVRAQSELEEALVRVEQALPERVRPTRMLRPVVGDELQGVHAGLGDAIAATLLLQLALPDGIELRFGLGIGEIQAIPSTRAAVPELPEGPAWWAARAAVEHVEEIARRQARHARTWVEASPDESADTAHLVGIANAGLLVRDHVVGRWAARTRRLVYGRIAGASQTELAASERITQSAVSQALAASGAGEIITGYRQLVGD